MTVQIATGIRGRTRLTFKADATMQAVANGELKPSTTAKSVEVAALEKKYEEMRRNILLTPAQVRILAERINALTNEEASVALDYAFKDLDKADARNPRVVAAHILLCMAGVYGLIPPELKKVCPNPFPSKA